jgi:flagellar hook-associated protein 2
MASITSAGVGSGLDIETIMSSLMSAEQTSLSKIKTQKTEINTKISIYGIIKSSFASLQTAADKLTSLSNLNPLTATSSSESTVTATASSSATKGNYSIAVSQLAKAQSVASSAVTSSDTNVGTGSLTITLGSYDSTGNTFTAKSSATPVTISIGSGQQTLSGIKDAINNASAGVTASIVNDGSGARLVLTSSETGESNGFKLTVSDSDSTNTDTSGLSMLAFDPTATAGAGKNATSLQVSQDAKFTVNGLSITKTSNTVTDAVEGLTLNLKDVTTSATTIKVGLDDTTLKSTLNEFVSAYNKIRSNLKDQQEKDATLSKETSPATLERGLRNILKDSVSAYGLSMADVGLSFDKTGVLSLNSTKLDTAIASDSSVLKKLFMNTGTTTDARVKYTGSTTATQEGTYAINVTTAYNSSTSTTVVGTVNGVAGTGIGNVLTGASGDATEGLQFSVNEGESGSLGTITYSKGLAARLSDWIDTLNDEGGLLASRTDGLNAKLKRLDTQTDRETLRLEQVEKRYRAQYTALDTMMASMKQTSSYLTQQLAALSS